MEWADRSICSKAISHELDCFELSFSTLFVTMSPTGRKYVVNSPGTPRGSSNRRLTWMFALKLIVRITRFQHLSSQAIVRNINFLIALGAGSYGCFYAGTNVRQLFRYHDSSLLSDLLPPSSALMELIIPSPSSAHLCHCPKRLAMLVAQCSSQSILNARTCSSFTSLLHNAGSSSSLPSPTHFSCSCIAQRCWSRWHHREEARLAGSARALGQRGHGLVVSTRRHGACRDTWSPSRHWRYWGGRSW